MTYVHPQDPNLNNLAKSMKLNDVGTGIGKRVCMCC